MQKKAKEMNVTSTFDVVWQQKQTKIARIDLINIYIYAIEKISFDLLNKSIVDCYKKVNNVYVMIEVLEDDFAMVK